MWMPSCENATDLILLVWPINFYSSAPVKVSHTHTELSSEPETILMSLDENATELIKSRWPYKCCSSVPVEAPHICTDLAIELETILVSSCETTTEKMLSLVCIAINGIVILPLIWVKIGIKRKYFIYVWDIKLFFGQIANAKIYNGVLKGLQNLQWNI